jgi:hypothetical protein
VLPVVPSCHLVDVVVVVVLRTCCVIDNGVKAPAGADNGECDGSLLR